MLSMVFNVYSIKDISNQVFSNFVVKIKKTDNFVAEISFFLSPKSNGKSQNGIENVLGRGRIKMQFDFFGIWRFLKDENNRCVWCR